MLGKLVELLDEIKRVGRHYEPLNSAVYVARLETEEEFAQEEARLSSGNKGYDLYRNWTRLCQLD